MALTTQQKQQLYNSATNLIYAWIAKKDLAYFPQPYRDIITRKRAYQLRFMTTIAQQAGDAYSEVTKFVQDSIIQIYGMTPAQVIYKLAAGETVGGKNWKQGIYGIGFTPSTVYSNTAYTVNPDTGDVLLNGKVVTKKKKNNTYCTAYTYGNDGNKIGKGDVYLEGKTYYDKKTNKTYSTTLNDETGKYMVGLESDGNITIASDGTEVPPDKSSLFENSQVLVTFFTKLFELITNLFKIDTVSSSDIQINQVEDGFEPYQSQSTSKASVGLIGGAVLLALLASNKENPDLSKAGKKKVKK